MQDRVSQAGALVASLLAIALGCVTPEERLFQPKWSDDGTKAIVLIKRWRSGPRVFDTPTSDGRSFELRVMELEGAVLWSERFDESPGSWSFFVDEGYVFYTTSNGRESVLQPVDGTSPRRVEGGRRPSPNGRWLTRSQSPVGSCDPCEYVREFFDSRTLEPTSPPVRYPAPESSRARDFAWTMWIDDEHLVHWTEETSVVVRVDGSLFDPAPRPTCTGPTTRGGVRDDQGRPLHGELVGDRVVLTIGESDGPPWPLRCWPHGGPEEW
ncbi:MAG: hypothetical protein KF901_05630 [Myxococcales bacterium]|nr:hypothetical protein [Myxococcales bacterium]